MSIEKNNHRQSAGAAEVALPRLMVVADYHREYGCQLFSEKKMEPSCSGLQRSGNQSHSSLGTSLEVARRIGPIMRSSKHVLLVRNI